MAQSTTQSVGVFLKEYWTQIAAIYGVIQIWLIWLYKKIFKNPKIEIFPANVIEIGYSYFGPTLGLYGTLNAVNKDVFISRVDLQVKRLRDNASYSFEWTAFRSNQFTMGNVSNIQLELPSGFIVSLSQPHRFNILFSDIERKNQEMMPLMRNVDSIWDARVQWALTQQPVPNSTDLFNQWVTPIAPKGVLDFYSGIERLCYWDEGRYLLTIVIQTENPANRFSFNRNFEISTEDSRRLRNNALSILKEMCAQQNVTYNFAFSRI